MKMAFKHISKDLKNAGICSEKLFSNLKAAEHNCMLIKQDSKF
jgi:hypothetical protein